MQHRLEINMSHTTPKTMLATTSVLVSRTIGLLAMIVFFSHLALGQAANETINKREKSLDDYRLAGELYQQQKWIESAEVFRRVATNAPGTALASYATYYEIECLSADGQMDRALPLLKNWLLENEKHVENAAAAEASTPPSTITELFYRGQYRLAELSIRRGDNATAMEAYQKVSQHTQDVSLQGQSLLAIARIRQKQNQPEQARQVFQEIIGKTELTQWHSEARLGVISLDIADGNSENAIEKLEQLAQQTDSKDVAAIASLQAAQLYYTRGNFDKALPLFTESVEKSKSAAVIAAAKTGVANASYALGKKDEAIAVLSDYVAQHQVDAYWTQNYYQLIRWQLAAGKLEEAASGLARLEDVGFATSEEESQWQRTQSLYLRVGGRNKEAAEALTQAIEKAPAKTVPELRKELLNIRVATGDYDAAIKELEAWEAEPDLDPDLERFYALKKLEVLVQQKRWQEATQSIERWLGQNELDPQRSDALVLLAQCKIATAEIETARNILTDPAFAAESASDSIKGQAQWLIGETYLLQKDYFSAVDAYSKVANQCRDSKWQAYALLQAGKCYEITGQTAEATQLYEQGLKIAPNDTLQKSLQQRLKEIKPQRTSSLTPSSGITIPSPSTNKR